MNHWIWVFSEDEAFRAVLNTHEMLFRNHASDRVAQMSKGDQAVFYMTIGAFHQTHRDVSRLAGIGEVTDQPRREPRHLMGEEFPWRVPFRNKVVLPRRQGPQVKNLISDLRFVENQAAWGGYFRPSPISVSRHDYLILERAIAAWSNDNT